MAEEKDEQQEPDMEEACFQIISTVGCAKSNFIDAIQKAKAGDFETAKSLIEEGKQTYLEGHKVHMGLLQEDAQKMGSTKVPLLLVHAEDQLMQAETVRIMAEDLVDVYQKLADLQK
ncbi:MAG: PTS lactose/cellobiose transporter subunit IIA [Parafannyhessea sp.]|uniref:PTS lactose/cellobiose transporter subunit IIA n=1 Tax=Parafannyhessea sp. TaxID=2847324 RepID=UPI003F12A524